MWLQKSPNGGGALLLSSNCKITLKIGQKPLSSPTEWVVTAKATTTPKPMQPSLTSPPPAAFETEKSKPTAGPIEGIPIPKRRLYCWYPKVSNVVKKVKKPLILARARYKNGRASCRERVWKDE